MLKINLLSNALKSLIIILPLVSSLIMYLLLLNISIWIYDETKITQSVKKSKKVLVFGLLLCLTIAVLFFFRSIPVFLI